MVDPHPLCCVQYLLYHHFSHLGQKFRAAGMVQDYRAVPVLCLDSCDFFYLALAAYRQDHQAAIPDTGLDRKDIQAHAGKNKPVQAKESS